MSDYNVSSEARQARLNQQRLKIKENMNKKLMLQTKSISANDHHTKTSHKFSLLKEDYSPLVTEESNNNTKGEISKFAYDGPQTYELMNMEDKLDVVYLSQNEDFKGAMVIKNDYINGLREEDVASTFDYSRLPFEDSKVDCDVEANVIECLTSKIQKSSETLKTQSRLPINVPPTSKSLDGGLNDASDFVSALTPSFVEVARDNSDSNDDVDSIQLESTDEGNGHKPLINLVDLPAEIETFVSTPAPENYVVKCRISRDKRGVDKGMYPIYYLHLERSNAKPLFLLAARRRKMSKTSNYLISCDATDMKRDGFGFLAKLRSNFVGTQFSIYDNGQNPGSKRNLIKKPSRRELAAIIYESNVLGFKGPRKMAIVIPAISNEGIPIDFNPKENEDGLIECWKKKNMHNLLELHNKRPIWNDDSQSYVLNFHGRVTQASVKNFQVVHDNDVDYIVMQFGRTSDNSFSMDYSYPLSAVQAFGIALSSFDSKLACE